MLAYLIREKQGGLREAMKMEELEFETLDLAGVRLRRTGVRERDREIIITN